MTVSPVYVSILPHIATWCQQITTYCVYALYQNNGTLFDQRGIDAAPLMSLPPKTDP